MIADIDEILDLHQRGTFSRLDVLGHVFDLIDRHGVDAVLRGLPSSWRELFIRWARSQYDNETPATEYVVLHHAEIPPDKVRAIEAIRAYFHRPDAPPPVRVVVDEADLRRVGWFRETGFEDMPSLVDARDKRRRAHTGDVARYLKGGRIHIASAEIVEDGLDGAAPRTAGTKSLRTDGMFLWPDSLAYYVTRYLVALPEEFEEHMRLKDWILPDEVEVRVGGAGSETRK
jgi:hypothetical protein